MQKILFSYLKFWTKIYLKRAKPEIIAITGSVGKTSTKEAIFTVLLEKFGSDVEKSYGNLNNETGAPLAILGYKKSPANFLMWFSVTFTVPFRAFFHPKKKFLVLELGADKPGDIKYLASFIQPKVAVLTSIGISHLQAFGSVEKITEEKADLVRALSIEDKDSWAVLNVDDDQVRKISYANKYQKKTYSLINPANFMAKNVKVAISNFKPQTTFELNFEKEKIAINQPNLGGKSAAYASLAAAAVGEIYGLTPAEIEKGLNKVLSENHRLNILQGKSGATIIDDCYNASPASVKMALEILENLPGRKTVVLGDMLELGKVSKESHLEVGILTKKSSDDQIAIGNLAKNYGFKNYFRNIKPAADYLLKKTGKNDIILIKASRRIGLEKLVEDLKK